MRRDSGYADFRQMLDNQFIETRIKRRKQQYSRRRVSVERGHARVQRCSEWHGERRCQRIVEPGIEHLGRRGGNDYAVPTALGDKVFDPPDDKFSFVRDLIKRLTVEIQPLKIDLDFLGNDR